MTRVPTQATTKADQSEATRARLLKIARTLFTKRGYAGTSLEEITRRAKLTKGALYHHFESKQAIFTAVYLQVEEELAEQVLSATEGVAVERRLKVGFATYLDLCTDPTVGQIVLIDAPSAVDSREYDRITEEYALAMTVEALRAAMAAGYLRRHPVEPLARVLVGGLREAGRAVARAGDDGAARAETGKAIDHLLNGLRR